MENTKPLMWMFAILCVALVAMSFVMYSREPVVVQQGGSSGVGEVSRPNTVTVSGSAERKVAPDKAVLMLSIETTSLLAKNAEEENSLAMEKVMKAIQAAGVEKKNIVTEYYNIYPFQDYDPVTQRYVEKGFKAQHTLKVTVLDVSSVGKVLDAAVNAGVTNVQSTYFTLSDDAEKKIREELISEAAAKARARADQMTSALGVSVGRVVGIHEDAGYQPPIYYAKSMMAEMAVSDGMGMPRNAIPDVTGEDVTVSTSISVEFEIKN